MGEDRLSDEAARERVRTELDRTLFVEAGAGSGKTTVLVDRIVALVDSGRCAMRSVAAITFTEAAAAELRMRTQVALAGRHLAEPERAAIGAALDELDEATITTIHGFARRVLAEFPLEAGLPLRFQVIDDVEATLAFEARFSSFADSLAARPEDALLVGAALAVGLGARALRDLARDLDERWDAFLEVAPSPGCAMLSERVDAALAAVVPALDALVAYAQHCVADEDRMHACLVRLAAERAALDEADDAIERLEWLARLPVAGGIPQTNKAAWTCDVGAVRNGFATLRERRAEALAPLVDLVLRAVLDRLGAAALDAARQRQRAGELTYHDLLVHARTLLASHGEVRDRLGERYRAILVDEFQDTDPLQLELVNLLAGAPAPAPGRQFFVGDPKQAIYRFRGADLGLYLRARDAAPSDDTVALTTNFRSVPGIVSFVNATFARAFSTGDNVALAAGVALVAHRDATEDAAPVLVVGGPLADKVTALARRELEAEAIADVLGEVIDRPYTVHERGGAPRPARLSDIAVLVPRRTGVAQLEAALSAAEIAYRIESPSLLYETSEVRELLACLRALAFPGEEAAVVAALRTTLLSCSDEELLAHRRAGGQWRIGPRGSAPEGRVGEMLAYLDDLEHARHRTNLAGLVSLLVAERGAFELAAASAHPVEAARALGFLFAEVAAFSESSGRDLGTFCAWARRRAADDHRPVEAVLDSPVEAVRICTIHAAKGLEFPVVVLAELAGALDRAPSSPAVLAEDGRVEARVRSGLETSGFASLAAAERAHNAAEALRLGYVGATRARDHLVVCCHHDASGKDVSASLATELYAAALAAPELVRHYVAPEPGSPRRHRAHAATATVAPEELAHRRARRAELAARANTVRSVAASSLGEALPIAPGRAVPGEDVRDLLVPARRRDPTAIGRAAHAVLERIDLSSGAGLAPACAAACAEEHCGDDADRVAALVAGAIAHPLIGEALGARRYFRELPLSFATDGGVLEGIVDLCFEDGAGDLVVVDYKTDALEAPGSLEGRVEHYGLQLGAYALGLEAATGRRVARCVLLFLAAPGGALAHDLGPVAALAGAARAALARRFSVVLPDALAEAEQLA